jgi:hypothetical protein
MTHLYFSFIGCLFIEIFGALGHTFPCCTYFVHYSIIERMSVGKKEIFNMKGAMALSAFRAGVGWKPKWGTLIRKNFVF